MIEIGSILEAERALADLQAAVFDLDDTLYSEKDYVRSGFKAVAAMFPSVPEMAAQLWKAFENGLPAIDAVLVANDLAEHKKEALHAYRSHMPEIEAYPGVRSMLERLRETKKLALITDGRPEGQRAKIKALGIGTLFDVIVITDELGGLEFRKPNDAAFRLVQKELSVPFEAMAYVGDNPRKDFIAPDKLGMRSVWFRNPDGIYYEEKR